MSNFSDFKYDGRLSDRLSVEPHICINCNYDQLVRRKCTYLCDLEELSWLLGAFENIPATKHPVEKPSKRAILLSYWSFSRWRRWKWTSQFSRSRKHFSLESSCVKKIISGNLRIVEAFWSKSPFVGDFQPILFVLCWYSSQLISHFIFFNSQYSCSLWDTHFSCKRNEVPKGNLNIDYWVWIVSHFKLEI